MKKRITALLLCLVLILGAFPAVSFAAGRFDDTDAVTLQNTDILGMMGIISDHPQKKFRPEDNLSRSEFCKMAVVAMGNEKLVSQYKNASIFPDVRASHWASGYIGVAAKGPGSFIKGYANGNFGPDNSITYAEAITIIMRLLGYTDKDSGGVWPDGYIDLAQKSKVYVDGVTKYGYITRAQAVALFVDMFGAENAAGIPFYKSVGAMTMEKMTIVSADGGTGRVKFSDGTVKYMAVPCAISTIIGRSGTAVFNTDGKLIMFMPDALVKSNAPASAAIIVSRGGSTAGFDSLTGGSKTYSIYKNGERIEAKDIRMYDVATYNSATDTVVLCDSRLYTYYKNCIPSASHPTKVTVFDNLELNVLSTAQDMMAAFKPGMNLTFLFTADGQIAGALNSVNYANMLAAVDETGNVSLICGTGLIPVPGLRIDEKYYGRIVSLRGSSNGEVQVTVQSRKASLNLNVKDRTCDGKKLAENVMIFSLGTTALESDFPDTVASSKIDFYRTDSKGNVDLINIRDTNAGTVYSGKAQITKDYDFDFVGNPYQADKLQIVYGNDSDFVSPSGTFSADVTEGSYICATYRNGHYVNIQALKKIGKVSEEAFIGRNAVNVGGVTLEVDRNCVFFNQDSKLWIEDADAAFEYADLMTVYAADDVVRLIVVEAVTSTAAN